MPGEAEMPSRISDTSVLLLVEFLLDQFDQLAQSSFRVITGGADDNVTAELGGQHHHAHDALAVDFELLFAHEDFRLKAIGQLDELRGWSGMQPVVVANRDGLLQLDGYTHASTPTARLMSAAAEMARTTGTRQRAPKLIPIAAATMPARVQGNEVSCVKGRPASNSTR